MASHSESVLGQLREYDSFLESLRTIADMGCGTGQDMTWWATLASRDDNPEPYNYKCFAVDIDGSKLAQVPDLINITKLERDFTKPNILPTNIDLMFAHDCLHYSINPLETLKFWNDQMSVNGMLVLSVQQNSGVQYNKYYSRSYSGSFFDYTPVNLIYMLAVNGFDCNDAYLLKKYNDPWIDIAVYKSNIAPMDPAKTKWEHLIDTGLLNHSVVNSILKNGHVRQEEIVYPWLDKENYFVDWIRQQTEIPMEAGDPIIDGVFNKSEASTTTTVEQATAKIKGTDLLTPTGVMRVPKGRYVK